MEKVQIIPLECKDHSGHRRLLPSPPDQPSPPSLPITIKFTWICKDRRKDKDNVRVGAKYILDGLVEAGVLRGDGWNQIQGFTDHFDIDRKNPRIEVELI